MRRVHACFELEVIVLQQNWNPKGLARSLLMVCRLLANVVPMPVGWGCVVSGAEACWQGQKAIELYDNGLYVLASTL